ncbi:MAG: nitroreductase family protein [Actinomycetota bacterium]
MEFDAVIAAQRMVRPPYQDRPIPREVLERVLLASRKAPSAGFTQGVSFLILEGQDAKRFWEITRTNNRPSTPVIVIPLYSKKAYLDRYSEPDKQKSGMGGNEAAWPAPYWIIDGSFSAMLVMLAATAEGIGAWFFAIFQGHKELLDEFGVPDEFEPIGAIAMGYPTNAKVRSPSLARGRKPLEELLHFGKW